MRREPVKAGRDLPRKLGAGGFCWTHARPAVICECSRWPPVADGPSVAESSARHVPNWNESSKMAKMMKYG